LRFDQSDQAPQRVQGDTRFAFLRQLAADERIEHPTRHYDLKSIRQAHDEDAGTMGLHDFDF
jgi:hypothetical protein